MLQWPANCSSEPLPSLKEVLSLELDFWTQKQVISESGSIPWKTKEEIVQSSDTTDLRYACYSEVQVISVGVTHQEEADMMPDRGVYFNV